MTPPELEPRNRKLGVLRSVLPQRARIESVGYRILINGTPFEVAWAGEGWLGDVAPIVARESPPDIVVARRLSPGARQLLGQAGIGWADESGAAEIARGLIVVSRTGHRLAPVAKAPRWTPAVAAVAEALLCGTQATVSATRRATQLSAGSCTRALRVLTELNLLTASAKRGRYAARQVEDANALLKAYVAAVADLPPPIHLQVGVTWRDPVSGVAALGKRWRDAGLRWAATGAVAAAVVAPHLTSITTSQVYVDASSLAELSAAAQLGDLRVIEGGRLTLLTPPTRSALEMREERGDVIVAPWPRVYADLRPLGVRGEEAAEHLKEVCLG